MTIATITLNPAVDKSTSVDRVVPEKKLRCEEPIWEPGGGGINVSRVLHRLGAAPVTIITSGGPIGQLLETLLQHEGVSYQAIATQAWTRESLAVVETTTGRQFRFGLPGPTLQEAEWKSTFQILDQLDPMPAFLVASGSLPPGMPEDYYARVAEWAHGRGVRLVLDTSGPPLSLALEAGVYLVKPNLGELAALHGKETITGREQETLAQSLIAEGKAELVAISLGARGAMLAHKNGLEYAAPPTVIAKSTIGAGDSMVAGLVWALSQNLPLPQVLRYGVACGTATTMRPGTGLCHKEDVELLLAWME